MLMDVSYIIKLSIPRNLVFVRYNFTKIFVFSLLISINALLSLLRQEYLLEDRLEKILKYLVKR